MIQLLICDSYGLVCLMPKPSFLKNNWNIIYVQRKGIEPHYTPIAEEIMRFNTFIQTISPKVNIGARLEFEFVYFVATAISLQGLWFLAILLFF